MLLKSVSQETPNTAGLQELDADEMIEEKPAEAKEPAESIAWIVNEYVPAMVGVPEIIPVVEFSASPGGSCVPAVPHVYGATPPVADKVAV